jgi:DNA helicase-2/ATP-dependent DNA helicase PcrA
MRRAVDQGVPLWTVLPQADSDPDLPHGVGARVQQFQALIEGFRARLGREPLAALATELVNVIDYRAELKRAYRDASEAEARLKGVEELVSSIALYEGRAEDPSLLGFLEETQLAGREFEKEDDRKSHALTLMTLHSAKGLEFNIVYLVGMEEGLLPHARSVAEGRGIEEERRLCYVGVTRARESLTLSFSKGRMKWGKMRPSIPSRFLFEMRGETERAQRAAAAAAAAFQNDASVDPAGAERADAKPDKTKAEAAPAAKKAKRALTKSRKG